MTAPDSLIGAARLASLLQIPCDEGGPVFADPWEAQAFALADRKAAWVDAYRHTPHGKPVELINR